MSKNTINSIQDMLANPGPSHSVLLTSFRRNGQGVGAPVGMVAADGKLYFMTPADTWKVKRIARNPHVQLALCTFRGEVLSPAVDGVARRMSGSEAQRARKLLRANLLGWFWHIVFSIRYPGDKTAVYEIALETQPEADSSLPASTNEPVEKNAR